MPRRRRTQPAVVVDTSSPAALPLGTAEKRLRQLALERGHRTLGAVATEAQIHRHTLLWAVRGERTPSPRILERIAHALRVDVGLLSRIFEQARDEKRS